MLGDLLSPVGLYLRLRDRFPNALLLESSDYNKKQNSYSYICLQAMASFRADRQQAQISYPDGSQQTISMQEQELAGALNDFVKGFRVEGDTFDFLTQGLFGYTSYDAIPMHHPVATEQLPMDVPLVHYQYFRFVLVFNHFNNELYLVENLPEHAGSELSLVEQCICSGAQPDYPFETLGSVDSNFTDEEFLKLIDQGKEHCYLGNVFQVVLSRQFSTGFKGDEFNVYRALRSVNPSPYLFYFDYGAYKIMGSSPEAQITIAHGKATIHPIAGTFKRTGNMEQDEELALALANDPKENAEHVMLVDLARNDLSINSDAVQVEKFKSVEMYSHVIHLVSKVAAELKEDYNAVEIFLNTFPAGTLSGAPKYRAMQLIDELENTPRGFYGGAIGIIGLDGSFNHAIFIRSLWSRKQRLYYQAGCGVVARSVAQSELQEIYNKVGAVTSAIKLAQNIEGH